MNFKIDDKVIIVNTDNIWENKKGIILGDYTNDEITEDTEEYLVKVFFDSGKTIIQPFDEDNLKLESEEEEMTERLNESKETNKEDFIHNYVYLEDIDDNKVPSWMFVDKIAVAENISAEDIIEEAKANGYKLFELSQNNFKKILVAAPKCKADVIYSECSEYVLGFATVTEIVDKGE